MNVLGINFDSKLNWQSHVRIAIKKSQKALQAIRIIKKHFTKKELYSLVLSNYYSILFYNSQIWLIPSLSNNTKNSLLSSSAKPLKICYPHYDRFVSFELLHQAQQPRKQSSITTMHYCYTKLTIPLTKIRTGLTSISTKASITD